MSPAGISSTFGALLVCFSWPLFAQEVMSSDKENFKVEVLAEGLSNPWAVAELPDGRLLVTERSGALRIIEGGRLLEAKVAGLPPVFAQGQGGLLDVELHPDYASNGWLYLSFSDPRGDRATTKIIRGRLKDMVLVDQEVLFQAPDADYFKGGVHFGCRITFDHKGFFYFGIGDRGDKTDPSNHAQKLTNCAGKIHRLHDDGRIPADNPFVKTPGALPSIWAYGVRNPQGLVYDVKTDRLWECEHGPKGGDELNLIERGKNYGWPLITYGINYSGTPITNHTSQDGLEQPVKYWVPSPAFSGLEVYNGRAFKAWAGNIFLTALAHQKLIRVELDANGSAIREEILLEKTGRIRDIRTLQDGSLCVVYDDPGKVVRLVPTP